MLEQQAKAIKTITCVLSKMEGYGSEKLITSKKTNDDLKVIGANVEGKYVHLYLNLLQDHPDIIYTKSTGFLVVLDNLYKIDDTSQNSQAAFFSWKYHMVSRASSNITAATTETQQQQDNEEMEDEEEESGAQTDASSSPFSINVESTSRRTPPSSSSTTSSSAPLHTFLSFKKDKKDSVISFLFF